MLIKYRPGKMPGQLVKDLSQILRVLAAFSFAVLCSLFFTCEDTDLLRFSKCFDYEIRSPMETNCEAVEASNIAEIEFTECVHFQSNNFFRVILSKRRSKLRVKPICCRQNFGRLLNRL